MGAAELTERLAPQAIDDIPVGHYVPLLEFNRVDRGPEANCLQQVRHVFACERGREGEESSRVRQRTRHFRD